MSIRHFIVGLQLFVVSVLANAQAQRPDSLTLDVFLEDFVSLKPVEEAKVTLFHGKDTTFLGTGQYRYIYKEPAWAYFFTARLPLLSSCFVKVEAEGYESAFEKVDIPKDKYKFAPTRYWQTKIRLFPIREEVLGNVEVMASKILMVNKGDTLEYNAEALQLSDGDMLETLIRNLPGVRIDEHGRITVNGEFVSSLLINGKDFFSGDPSVALKALPAYTVQKVKVYRKTPLGEFEDVSREQKDLVMDVGLKQKYMGSWLLEATLSGGAETSAPATGLYAGSLSLMRYTDRSNIALFGNVNNINDLWVTTQMGTIWAINPDMEWNKVQIGGLGFSFDESRKFRMATDLLAVCTQGDLRTETGSESYVEHGNIYRNSALNRHNDKTDLKWKGWMEYKDEDFIFYLKELSLNYRRTDHHAQSRSVSLGADEKGEYPDGELDDFFAPMGSEAYLQSLINRRHQMTLGIQEELGGKLIGNISLRDPWWGKKYTLRWGGNYKNTRDKSYQDDRTEYGATGVTAGTDGFRQNRYETAPVTQYGYYASLAFQPVNRSVRTDRNREWGLTLDFSYKGSFEYKSGERSLYRLENVDGWQAPDWASTDWSDFENTLRGTGDSWQDAVDLNNTWHTVERNFWQDLQIRFGSREKQNGKFSFSMSPNFRFLHAEIEDLRGNQARTISRRYVLPEPSVRMAYGGFSLNYCYRETAPTLLYLLDVRDDSDPLHVSLGNPDLRKMKSNQVGARFEKRTTVRQRIYSVNAGYEWNRDVTVMARTYDRNTGRTVTQPLNTDGDWLATVGANYGQRLDEDGKLTMDASSAFRLGHSADYVSDTPEMGTGRQNVQNISWTNDLKLTYSFTRRTRLKALANAKWSHVDGDRADFVKIKATDFSYGLDFTTQLPGKLDFDTKITMYSRRGYVDPSMNDDCLVWNVGLARTFGKNKNWIVKASANDLLRQISNVRNTINAYGRTEVRYQTLSSYALLKVTYRLNVEPKKD